jgi:aryl-alcohol dehydrogenase-like predicted oxidoreductase
MRYRLLGRSGLRVSEVCLGAMTFGGGTAVAAGADDAESRAIFDAFAEAGGNFIDTACSYSNGRSETLLGDFLAADRDHFVVATKYTNSHGGGLARSGNSRRNMLRTVEESLQRLKTDCIDLFWLHNWDSTTPIDEVMRGFQDLIASGKARYVGMSNTPAWEIARGNMMADLLGMSPLIAIEIELSLLQREPENDLLPMARALDLGVLAWSPLATGLLARPPGAAGHRAPHHALSEQGTELVRLVGEIAGEVGASQAQVALAALRRLPRYYAAVIPILGASRREQLVDGLGFLDLQLSEAQIAALDAASAPRLIYPHGLLRSELGERLTTGGQAGVLDNHRR